MDVNDQSNGWNELLQLCLWINILNKGEIVLVFWWRNLRLMKWWLNDHKNSEFNWGIMKTILAFLLQKVRKLNQVLTKTQWVLCELMLLDMSYLCKFSMDYIGSLVQLKQLQLDRYCWIKSIVELRVFPVFRILSCM